MVIEAALTEQIHWVGCGVESSGMQMEHLSHNVPEKQRYTDKRASKLVAQRLPTPMHAAAEDGCSRHASGSHTESSPWGLLQGGLLSGLTQVDGMHDPCYPKYTILAM